LRGAEREKEVYRSLRAYGRVRWSRMFERGRGRFRQYVQRQVATMRHNKGAQRCYQKEGNIDVRHVAGRAGTRCCRRAKWWRHAPPHADSAKGAGAMA